LQVHCTAKVFKILTICYEKYHVFWDSERQQWGTLTYQVASVQIQQLALSFEL